MPYVAPKPQDIKARFPEFDSVPDARIALAIQDAGQWVDTSWLMASYAPALRYLTAHILLTEGALDGGASVGRGALVSDSLGDASQTYADPALSFKGSDVQLGSTAYGREFMRLRRANHPAVLVV